MSPLVIPKVWPQASPFQVRPGLDTACMPTTQTVTTFLFDIQTIIGCRAATSHIPTGAPSVIWMMAEYAYRCPAGERLPCRYTNEEDSKVLRRYWTTACQNRSQKSQCTT